MLVQDGRYFAKRSSDPITLPTDEGISGVIDATAGPTATASLAVDSGASAGSVPAAPVFTVVQTALPTQSGNAAGAVSSSKSIPVSAVIGSCIGAFIFVSALIIFGVWFYRRYSQSLRRQALSRGSLKLRLKPAQRRPWSKLEDDEDKGANTNQTKEVDQVVPMEKLTMFKRAASVRTAYTQKSVDDHTLTYPHSFAPFDTNLVRTLSADPTIVPRSQSSEAISIKTPKLSPSTTNFGEPFNMAIPTPEATVLQSHKWESAEVVQYEGHEVVEPSVQDKEVKSLHNPFFGSQDYSLSRPSEEKLPNGKGRQPAHDSISSSLLSSDPFEALVAKLPKPSVQLPTDSSASTQSKTRALQTLMGALELSEDEVRDRLRVASMQLSDVSHYATPIDEEFVDNRP